ncbi:MAG: serine protease [Rubripirellula sp.]
MKQSFADYVSRGLRPSWSLRLSIFLSMLLFDFTTHDRQIFAQSVILPMPRLTTIMPMGGQLGTTVEVKISGEYLDGTRSLMFSDPRLIVEPVTDSSGNAIPDRFRVTIPDKSEVGSLEARVHTRLGVSTPRVFTLSDLPEVTQEAPSIRMEDAMPLEVPSVCNAYMPARSICYYQMECKEGQRLLIECAAKEIESKLNAVLIVADEQGRDLVVQRRGDYIDFSVPHDGRYYIKIHELTFKGGNEFFFRLKVREANEENLSSTPSGVLAVNSFSWPPSGLPHSAKETEREPNDDYAKPQQIELPCDLSGNFAKAADVDLFQFEGKKGEAWWVEVGSERLGCPTDVAVLVQRVVSTEEGVAYEDVIELNDIPSPVKVSTNHYAYDGPPYNAGSRDVLGEIKLPEDGTYVLRLVDLFGGTRSDPRNLYRLVIRQAKPDFSVVGWAMHMELRNGDRNAVSKPIALRNGSTMPLEVVVLRRDGFDEPIELFLENLPDGVTAAGVHLSKGENRGILLVTADEGAPAGFSEAKFVARAESQGQTIERQGKLASMAWPVKDHWQEIPAPRLLQSVVVSVSGEEVSPLSIRSQERKTWEVIEGEKLIIPLIHFRRSEFSSTLVNTRAFGKGLERFGAEIPIDSDHSELTIDLEAYPLPPGRHTIAIYGGVVTKYQYYTESIAIAEKELKKLQDRQSELEKQNKPASVAATEIQQQTESSDQETVDRLVKEIKDQIVAAEREVKRCVDRAKAKDIVDIVVSEPIELQVIAKVKP